MNHKEELRKLIDDLQKKRKEDRDNEENARKVKNDEDRNAILEGIGLDVADSLIKKLSPVVEELARNSKLSGEELKDALKNVFDGVSINIPPIKVPKAAITVNVPPMKEIKFPDIKFPNQPFPERFKIDDTVPLPVILTDTEGKRYGISQFAGGGSGKINKQYQERDVASLITGLAVMMEGANDELFPLQAGSGVSDRALRMVQATDSVSSVSLATALDYTIDSISVSQVSGSINSTQIQGLARQTNPTAVADGAAVKASFDDLGRQVIVPHQVRDLVTTAYTAVTTGTEASLIAAGGSGVFLDLIQIVAANTSDGTVSLDFRDATAGGIVFSVQCPASATTGFVPAVPYPQNVANLPWTVDMNDVSTTTVNVSALFIKNV